MYNQDTKRLSNRAVNHNRWHSNDKIPVDIIESDQGFLVKSYLPGFSKEEINVSVKDNLLTIKAETTKKKYNDNDILHMQEIATSNKVNRSFYIPSTCDVENLRAKLSHGILNLIIPKRINNSPKTIKIS